MTRAGTNRLPAVLTIAGSDSGGGAGIQADLKTFSRLDVFGTSAITCVTAQNPDGVRAIEAISPRVVRAQIEAVLDGFPVRAAKTGMLYSREVIRAVAGVLRQRPVPALVVDPVMVATSGARLLREDAIRLLCRVLLPTATVVTPNVPEAEILAGGSIRTLDDARTAARRIQARYGCACVLKGGHLEDTDGRVRDVLFDGRREHVFVQPRLAVRETHGTGCTFSAALAAFLGHGRTLADAVALAQRVVWQALAGSRPAGVHRPLRVEAATGRGHRDRRT